MGSPRSGEWIDACVGGAVRSQSGFGGEDLTPAAAERWDGKRRATARAAQQGDGRNGREPAGAGASAARSNAGGMAAGCRRGRQWWDTLARMAPERMVFLDKSAVMTAMTRLYGRAPAGRRARESIPAGHWKTVNILSALSTAGLLATMIVEAPADGDVFLAFLAQVPPSHRSAGYAAAVPTSLLAGLHPIEKARLKLKQHLCRTKARIVDLLFQALAGAIPTITSRKLPRPLPC